VGYIQHSSASYVRFQLGNAEVTLSVPRGEVQKNFSGEVIWQKVIESFNAESGKITKIEQGE